MPGSDASRRLSVIAAKLKAEGDRGLTNRTRRALRAVGTPLKDQVRQAARDQLPKSGGLNEHVAGQRITVSVPLGLRTATVRLRMPFIDAVESNKGFIRHPVYADASKPRKEWAWVQQEIPNASGFWTRTLLRAAPEVTAALMTVMREVDAEINDARWA